MTDFAALRRTMVETQLRTVDVTDARLLKAFADVPREQFLPEDLRALSYLDRDVQFSGSKRFMVSPQSLARLLQLASITAEEHVLDLGCATGYSTAVIAELAHSVIGLEEDSSLVAASPPLPDNARVLGGQLATGFVDGGPYDVIVIQGAVDAVPRDFALQLTPRGRLVAVTGQGRAARATVYTNTDNGLAARAVFDLGVPPLPQFQQKPVFQFAV